MVQQAGCSGGDATWLSGRRPWQAEEWWRLHSPLATDDDADDAGVPLADVGALPSRAEQRRSFRYCLILGVLSGCGLEDATDVIRPSAFRPSRPFG